MNAHPFLKLVHHPLKFRLFLLLKLPAAFFSGVRIRHASLERCVASVPFKWLTQNPFKSTYFASLSMAAEMSTGILAMTHVYKRNPPISMLVLHIEGEFNKKAAGRTYFECADGELIQRIITETTATGEGRTVRTKATGTNAAGETVATFYVTWSFKAKNKS